MARYLRLIVSVVLLLISYVSWGQNIGITTRIEPGEIQIGEQALVRLKIRTNDIDNTFLIIPPDTAIHRAEALSFRVTDTVHLEGTLKELSAEMVLTSFDSTLVTLPAFGVRVGEQEVYSQPLYLKVNLPEVDMEHPDEFFGLKSIWKRNYKLYDWWILLRYWLIGLGIALLAIIGFFLCRHFYNRHKHRAKNVTPPPISIIELFRLKMEELRTRQLPEKGLVESYYTELNMLLRSFLWNLLHINSLEMTSRQLIKALEERDYIPWLQEFKLYQFMEHSDLGKFANEAIQISECDEDYENVLRFVHALYNREVQAKQEVKEGRTKV